MNRRQPIVLLSAGLLIVGAGCWSPPSWTPAATPTAQTPSAATSTEMVATSTAPTPASAASTTTVKPKPAPKPAPAPVSHTVTVNILSSAFSPQVIAVSAGDTVVWVNKDTKPHGSKSDGALIWDTGSILPGKSAGHQFKSPGSYPYSDATTGMKGTVVVR